MMFVTVSKNSVNGAYVIHNPNFPYNRNVYYGYSLTEAKKKARKDFELEHKRIEWISI